VVANVLQGAEETKTPVGKRVRRGAGVPSPFSIYDARRCPADACRRARRCHLPSAVTGEAKDVVEVKCGGAEEQSEGNARRVLVGESGKCWVSKCSRLPDGRVSSEMLVSVPLGSYRL